MISYRVSVSSLLTTATNILVVVNPCPLAILITVLDQIIDTGTPPISAELSNPDPQNIYLVSELYLMEGASSGLAEYLDGILPMDVQFVLSWNPQLTVGQDSKAGPNTHTIGTRPAAFYNRHLAPHLTVEHVVRLDALVSTMANTVDQTIRDAVTKRPLPEDTGMLLFEKAIKHQVGASFDGPRCMRRGSWKPT